MSDNNKSEKNWLDVSCTVHYLYADRPADMSGKYEVTLGNLSDRAVTNLKGWGVNVKTNPKKPEFGHYITCTSHNPLTDRVFDQNGEVLTALVGSGSKAVATISTYKWTYKSKSGVSPSLFKLVITDLVPVERKQREVV